MRLKKITQSGRKNVVKARMNRWLQKIEKEPKSDVTNKIPLNKNKKFKSVKKPLQLLKSGRKAQKQWKKNLEKVHSVLQLSKFLSPPLPLPLWFHFSVFS